MLGYFILEEDAQKLELLDNPEIKKSLQETYFVVTDNDEESAVELRDELLQSAWDNRSSFVYQLKPLQESIEEGVAATSEDGDGPVILLDHYDNTASGGTMDTTEVLAEILRQGPYRSRAD